MPATWEEAFELIGKRFARFATEDGGAAIGVIGSTRTTNEENYLLSKFARVVLKTNNVDHHRTADFPALAAALHGKPGKTASMRDVLNAPAILLIGNDPTNQHPLLAWQIRTNVRLRRAKLYVVNSAQIKLQRQAAGLWICFPRVPKRKRLRSLAGTIPRSTRSSRDVHEPRGMDRAARSDSRRAESGDRFRLRAARSGDRKAGGICARRSTARN